MALPPTPEWAWAALCVDEAVHFHHAKWEGKQREQEREDRAADEGEPSDGGRNLYDQIRRDPRVGRPPPVAEFNKLPKIEDEPAADAR